MKSLQEFSHILVKSLKLRQKYMALSNQYFPQTVKNYLEKYFLDESSKPINNFNQRIEIVSNSDDGTFLFTHIF
jgi:hypothetical protein